MPTGHTAYMTDPETPAIPGARLIRVGGTAVGAPPRVAFLAWTAPLVRRLVLVLGYAVALWPLTGTALLAAALLWAVGVANAP
jgi:hypothetical protein